MFVLHCCIVASVPFYPNTNFELELDGGFMKRGNANAVNLRVVGIVFSRKMVWLMSCVVDGE
jgi:hypothetical protein